MAITIKSARHASVPLALAAVLGLATSQAIETSALRSGTDELTRGDLVHAAADLQAAIAAEPENPDAWYQLGLLYIKTTNFRAAEMAFRQAVRFRPHFPQAHFWLGWTLIIDPQSKVDWAGAIAESRLALADQPAYADALNLLGAGLTNLGQLPQAIEALEHAVAIQPPSAAAHFNLAAALEQSGRAEPAQKEYAAAITINNDYPEAHSALGKLLLSLGKPAQAEQSLLQALRENPDLPQAHYALARALQAQNKPAKVEFDQAAAITHLQADATQSSNLSNQSLGLAAHGDFVGAVQSLRRAIALKPDYGVPHYNLGLILADTGDFDGAIRELTVAISLMPGQAKPWFDLGRVFERKGDSAQAYRAFTWAARLAPENAALQSKLKSLPTPPASATSLGLPNDTAADHLAYGETLLHEGQALDAISELLRSLSLAPANQQARRDLANAYVALPNLDQASLEYHKLLLLVPHDAAAHIALGKILLKQNHAEQAASEFRSALADQPDSKEASTLLEQSIHAGSSH